MEETFTTKQDYDLCFLYDILEMIKGTFSIIESDKQLYRRFMELFNYISTRLELPYEGEITDMYVLVAQKK